jgi:hypothetical protein
MMMKSTCMMIMKFKSVDDGVETWVLFCQANYGREVVFLFFGGGEEDVECQD